MKRVKEVFIFVSSWEIIGGGAGRGERGVFPGNLQPRVGNLDRNTEDQPQNPRFLTWEFFTQSVEERCSTWDDISKHMCLPRAV